MTNVHVSAVVPTHNRLEALRQTLPRLLCVRGIDEIVVVVDGSTDGTVDFLAEIDDARLRFVVQPKSGPQLGRWTGVDTARGEWIFFIDDDDWVPSDHVEMLLEVARRRSADIVGSPWVSAQQQRSLEEELAILRAHPVTTKRLSDHPRVFPDRDLRTPYMCSIAIVRRTVFERVRHDPSYRGNSYREETDFYVSAVKAGFVTVLTPDTFSTTLGVVPGGHARTPAYEIWSIRNNWRFLWRHRRWLRANGCESITIEGVRFMLSRARPLARLSVDASLRKFTR